MSSLDFVDLPFKQFCKTVDKLAKPKKVRGFSKEKTDELNLEIDRERRKIYGDENYDTE